VQLAATNIAEMIERAEMQYPGFRARVLDDNGDVKRFINVFVNGVDIRALQGKQTPIKEGDEVSVIPAMAGGR
jgi:molybdopterin synthase sulfur carrier subunit